MMSKQETGGGQGVEVLKNEPYENENDKGQYTLKKYHLKERVPGWLRMVAPASALILDENAWNAYPNCKTELTSPYMEKNFFLRIETKHIGDRGTTENAHNLTEEQLKIREVVIIDIANDPIAKKDYKELEDPKKFKSEKTGRGPLEGEWQKTVEPVMCCYKLVTTNFKWWGLQGRVEKTIMTSERNLFFKMHRQLFCTMDQWHGLTMEDIRKLEDETQKALEEKRHKDPAYVHYVFVSLIRPEGSMAIDDS